MTRALVLLGLAWAATLVAPGAPSAGAWGDGNAVPYERDAGGVITELTDDGFRIDDLRVVVPDADATDLPWADTPVRIDADAVAEGEPVYVAGTLLPDGALLAHTVASVPAGAGEGLRWVGGVVDAVDDVSMTVDGVEVPVGAGVPFAAVGLDEDHPIGAGGIRAGDAVAGCVRVDDATGEELIEDLRVRPGGERSTLEGTITRLRDGDDASDDDSGHGSFLGHDGLFFEVEDVTCFVTVDWAEAALPRPWDGSAGPYERLGSEVGEGDDVRLEGLVRDGVFFVEGMSVPRRGAPGKTGRLRMTGVVSGTGRSFAVNGLGLAPRGRAPAGAGRLPLGSRVAVAARLSPTGASAVRVRRRR